MDNSSVSSVQSEEFDRITSTSNSRRPNRNRTISSEQDDINNSRSQISTQKRNHGDSPSPCPVRGCSKVYVSQRLLLLHLNAAHKTTKNLILPNEYVRCSCTHICRDKGLRSHQTKMKCALPSQVVDPTPSSPASPESRLAVDEVPDVPEVVPPWQVPNIPLLAELRSFYNQEISLFNPSWRTPYQSCVSFLLTSMVSANEDICYRGSYAFFILPGLVSRVKSHSKGKHDPRVIRIESPVVMLRRLAAAPDPGEAILETARRYFIPLSRVLENRQGNNRTPPATALEKRIAAECLIGRYSKAARSVELLNETIIQADIGEGPPVAQRLCSNEATEILADLYPPRTAKDDVQSYPSEVNSISVTIEEVRSTLRSLDIDKASGCSGWTNSALKLISSLGDEDTQIHFATKLTNLFNLLLSGKVSERVRGLWTDVKVALLQKPGTPISYRPIGIGEVLLRILAKTVQKNIGRRIGERLQPVQLALGVSGGVEIAAVITDLGSSRETVYDTPGGFATLSLDIKNAYNSVRRGYILEGLREYCPELIPFFTWVYGDEIAVRWASGDQVASSFSGCTQGDPLSTLYFAVALQPVLLQIGTILREEEEILWREEHDFSVDDIPTPAMVQLLHGTRGSVVAIADDISVSGRTGAVFKTADRISNLFQQRELDLNLTKCWIMGRQVHTVPSPPLGFILKEDGAKALGRPLGSIPHQRQWIQDRITSRAPPRRALNRLPHRLRLQLLRLVYNKRFDYLAKTTPLQVGLVPFKEHDQRIDDVLWDMGISDSREELGILRSLPLHQGGLGIPALSGPHTQRHRQITSKRCADFLERFYPTLLVVLNTFYVPNDQEVREDYDEYDGPATSLGRLIKSTREKVEREESEVMQRLHANLLNTPGREGHAARLLSAAAKGTGKWMTGWSWTGSSGRFTEAEFREALRCRLLSSFEPPLGRHNLLCACSTRREPIDLISDPTHPSTCSLNKGVIIERHDSIRNVLAKFLKRLHPQAQIVLEPVENGPAGHHRRPDIKAEINGRVFAIDVTIAEPASARAMLHRELSSQTIPDGAALQAEARKRAEYRSSIYEDHLVPFVIESTGRLGPAAKIFLDQVASQDFPSRSAFLLDISVLLACSLGRLSCRTRNRLMSVG